MFVLLDGGFIVLAPLLAWIIVRILSRYLQNRVFRNAVIGAVLIGAGCLYVLIFYLLSVPIKPIPPYVD